MPKALCLRCGKVWYGYALLIKKHRYCDCGDWLIIVEE